MLLVGGAAAVSQRLHGLVEEDFTASHPNIHATPRLILVVWVVFLGGGATSGLRRTPFQLAQAAEEQSHQKGRDQARDEADGEDDVADQPEEQADVLR